MGAVSRLSVFLFSVLLGISATAQAKKEKLTTVKDLRYGVALYWYYQGDYMNALSELMVAKERGGIQGHGDNPEIMEGGFALGYGMERHASDIFQRLLSENRSRDSQDAAWFFMSKLRYLRGDWAGAEAALEKVSDKPAIAIRDDVYAHRINLAIRQDQLAEAEKLLRKRNPGDDWMPYINYNLGSAYARHQKYLDSVAYFRRLAKQEYPTDELRALYDKAMTAGGYAYLLAGQYQLAIKEFSKVRLTSALSNRALLGYGWAASELGEFELALKPWIHLSQSSLVDENSQEALIAVPYAYEKLDKRGLALQGFQHAEQSFLEEIQRLEGVTQSMQGKQFLDALSLDRSEGMDWLKYVRDNQVSPQLSYLAELFAREEFQGVVQELRDLLGLQQDLLAWQDKLDFYADLMLEREQGRADRAAKLAAQDLTLQIKLMKAQRKQLAQKIERIAAERDFFALATEDEKDLIDRVLRSQKAIDALRETDPFIDESEEAIRRYYGILYWQASENFSDRMWRAVKTLNRLDSNLATITRNHEKVEYIINNAQDLAPLKSRIAQGQRRVKVQLARTDLAITATSYNLRQQTLAVLDEQRTRLNHYVAQSRLSIARLYDQSLQDEANAQAQLQKAAAEKMKAEGEQNAEPAAASATATDSLSEPGSGDASKADASDELNSTENTLPDGPSPTPDSEAGGAL
ncbi:hypothetical protein TDB9533_01855 [Thalassocella blandensis]|nr:hypothetical protein TDB9533_01855 [Thalassocella blandensis]